MLCIFVLTLACNSNTPKAKASADSPQAAINVNVAHASAQDDESNFRSLLGSFKLALIKKDFKATAGLMHFPFYTSNGTQGEGKGVATDPISADEFSNYQKDIFNADVLHLLPKYTEDQLSEIDEKTDDSYYNSLKKITDNGSRLYEVYFQYPEMHTQADNFFGFVFGKIDGKYRVIASYAKWPVK